MLTGTAANRSSAEPYVTNFESTVSTINGDEVCIKETYFYAEGGGQPADRGTLGGIEVIDVQTRDGETVHTLDVVPNFEVGDTVDGQIDTHFRKYCMRAHTASHLVYGAGRKLFNDHGYGGFDIGPEKIRLDFETSHDSSTVNPLTFERMVNEVVWESKDVTWQEMSTEQAHTHDEIIFNFSENATSNEIVRIVDIEGWDIAACGGTHVRNTREIGPVKVFDVSNPGTGLVRIEFAVGLNAIQQQINEARSTNRAADVLDTSVLELPQRATQLVNEKTSLEEKIDELSEQLLELQLRALQNDTISKNEKNWLVGEVEKVGSNAVKERVGDLVGNAGDVIALTGIDDSTFVVVGTTGDLNANDILDDITDEFGGGGGGRPNLAQGGGLNTDPESVVEYLREQY